MPVREIAVAGADTVMFCLSKGLGAPGRLDAGRRRDDIDRKGACTARRLGGGMRQAGVLAAAGLIALEQHPAKLGDDHGNAQAVRRSAGEVPGISIDPRKVQTNIVVFDVSGTGLPPPNSAPG